MDFASERALVDQEAVDGGDLGGPVPTMGRSAISARSPEIA